MSLNDKAPSHVSSGETIMIPGKYDTENLQYSSGTSRQYGVIKNSDMSGEQTYVRDKRRNNIAKAVVFLMVAATITAVVFIIIEKGNKDQLEAEQSTIAQKKVAADKEIASIKNSYYYSRYPDMYKNDLIKLEQASARYATQLSYQASAISNASANMTALSNLAISTSVFTAVGAFGTWVHKKRNLPPKLNYGMRWEGLREGLPLMIQAGNALYKEDTLNDAIKALEKHDQSTSDTRKTYWVNRNKREKDAQTLATIKSSKDSLDYSERIPDNVIRELLNGESTRRAMDKEDASTKRSIFSRAWNWLTTRKEEE